MKVVLTQRAEIALEEIADYYLAIYTPERTIKIIESIEEAFERIAKFPNSYPVCFDIKVPKQNIRQIIVHHTFKVVYHVLSDRIEVVEIFHGKRNPKLLKDIE